MTYPIRRRIAGASTIALLAAGLSAGWTPAHAQAAKGDAPAATLNELVVTAERRSASVQSVPMSITALGAETLERAGVADFQDYAVRIPNLSFSYVSSLNAGGQAIAIRGIFGAGTTGLYLDDTPLPMSVDPRVLDLQRIEVLKGPQGTLYGARSMGGTVRLITRQPDASDTQGFVHVVGALTRHGARDAAIDGMLNVPIVADRLALRATAYTDYVSGLFTRVAAPGAPVAFAPHDNVGAQHRKGGSLALQATFLDGDLTVTPRVLFARQRQNGHPYADIRPDNFVQTRLFDMAEPGSDRWELYGVTAHYVTPVGEFTSDTSRFVRRIADGEDASEVAALFFGIPPTPLPYRQRGSDRNFSQELRFTSSFEGPFQLTAGLFYQRGDRRITFPKTPLGSFFDNIYSSDVVTRVTEKAIFGQASYALTDKLTLTAGARLFDNTVRFDGAVDGITVTPAIVAGRQHEKGVNPKFGVEYQATSDALLYANAAKGFRVGGVNFFSDLLCRADLAALGLTPDQVRAFASDSLWNYEVGAKTRWADGRITVNGALFDIELSNVQQQVSLPNCGFGVAANSGSARSRGGELEIQAAVTSALKVSLGAGYNDAKITKSGRFNVIPVGARIQQVPHWTLNAAADYAFEVAALPAFVHADYQYVGSSFSTLNTSPRSPRIRPSYSLVNLKAGVEVNAWEVSLFLDNVFDEHANLSDVPSQAIELPGRPRISINRPRSVGVDARVRF